LEARALLSQGGVNLVPVYKPKDLAVYQLHTNNPVALDVKGQLLHNPSTQNPLLGNEGKIVSGKDRQGNEWTIVVHGPGTVIVTDTTPNDGSLDDAIDTIQLVGTDINKTYVTGNVVGSFRSLTGETGKVVGGFRSLTDSTTEFNKLVDVSGVRSIVLNGFSLAQTVTPAVGTPNNTTTGIFLTGGVQFLSFHDIIAPVDAATNDVGINIVIGDPSTPLPKQVQPTIHLDSIFNTAFNSTTTGIPPITPVTTPTVSIIVNGQLKGLDFISTTQDTEPAGHQFQFPTVATTGRTSVQAIGVGQINVAGAATNFTASRSPQPFQNSFTGLNHLNSAHFAGPTDAVGLDVNGPIGSLAFDKGIGNPAGQFLGKTASGAEVPATLYGLPADQNGYAASGLVAGQVTATNIGHLSVKPANVTLQTPTNPDFVQAFRQGSTVFIPRPGNALTNALIAASGSIGKTHILGNQVNSEIKSGFDYNSFAAGLEGTRAPSQIGPLKQSGNMINGVTSATYRPFMKFYGTPVDDAGPGRIRGNFNGSLANTQGVTTLGNVGAGFFAAAKQGGYLPPPEAPKRVHGVLVR
jgi:hypothetical protein